MYHPDMHPIPDILDDLRAGKIIVLADDEDRENEGDLVMAAEHATPEAMTFMLKVASGMMCVALDGSICDTLDLPPLTRRNTSQRSTAYTVTVDADEQFGLTTGVSAQDRAVTIRRLANPQAVPNDFARPGHTQPLRARDGGTLVRAGQTEGSVDLCKMAGLSPAAVIIEVMNDDGTMARRPELSMLCEKHGMKMCTVADVIEHRMSRDTLVERIETAPFTNEAGDWTLVAYRSSVDPFPHIALVCGDLAERNAQGQPHDDTDEPVLVRMHSQNLLGDVLGDLSQPSGGTLKAAMQMIQKAGRGAVVYLRHDRMGQGLLKRLHTPTSDQPNDDPPPLHANHTTPGIQPSKNLADYGIGSQILRDLGIRHLKLITNHPMHPTALSGFGLDIAEFVPVQR